MRRFLGGMDIGGTKCAVTLALEAEGRPQILGKERFPTPPTPEEAIARMTGALQKLLRDHRAEAVAAVGVSCGGPLDAQAGLVLGPPNLPGWERVDAVRPFKAAFGAPAALQNDANACALAEWMWGAGRGCRSMVFLTFGTGMGAGLILEGRLYGGANGMAGEAGHLRLRADGPVGYGKAGSFEGFCSGGGIARLARVMAEEQLGKGGSTAILAPGEPPDAVTAERVGQAAQAGDPLALAIWRLVGERLGEGLAVLIDLINPERIVIGSIFARQEALLRPAMEEALRREALPSPLAACRVLPAQLGESLGDFAALSVAARAANP